MLVANSKLKIVKNLNIKIILYIRRNVYHQHRHQFNTTATVYTLHQVVCECVKICRWCLRAHTYNIPSFALLQTYEYVSILQFCKNHCTSTIAMILNIHHRLRLMLFVLVEYSRIPPLYLYNWDVYTAYSIHIIHSLLYYMYNSSYR